MIYKVYSVFDVKAVAFMQPFFSPTRGQAIRSVTETLRDDKSLLVKYPEDFILHELGEFNDETGRSYRDWETDRKSTRLNSSHRSLSRMPSSA